MKHWRCLKCGKIVFFQFFHIGHAHPDIKIRWSWQRDTEGVAPEEVASSYFERVEKILGTWHTVRKF